MCLAPGIHLVSTNEVNFDLALEIMCRNFEKQSKGLDNDIRYITKAISDLHFYNKVDKIEKNNCTIKLCIYRYDL